MKKIILTTRPGINSFLLVFLLIIVGAISPHHQAQAQTRKVKIFLMAGQSNMQGHANGDQLRQILCAKDEISIPGAPNGCYSSLPNQEERLFSTISSFYGSHPTYDPVHARLEAQLISQYHQVDARLLFPFDKVQAINFNYRRQNGVRFDPGTWSGPLTIGYGFDNDQMSYGPELMFGHYLSSFSEDDIVLLKVAEGGTNLHVQWRSPSMEARLGPGDEPSNYPLLIQHLNEVRADIGSILPKYAGQAVETEVAGFVWFQGWNDAVNSEYASGYEQNLADLVTDLRNDLGMPELPVVIGQTQHTGENGLIVRAAQEAVGNSIGNASSVFTQDLSDYFHFDSGSHLVIGHRMGEEMKELLGLAPLHSTLPVAPSGLSTSVQPVLQVQLSWTDNSNNEDSFWVERSTNAQTGFEVIAIVPANTTSYLDAEISHGTTYYYRVHANNGIGDSPNSGTSSSTTSPLVNGMPVGWASTDVGNVALDGSTSYNEGEFTVIGNGYMTESFDNFHYAYQQLSGDAEIIAKLNFVQKAGWNNTGLMMRETLAPNASYAMTLVNANAKIFFQRRSSAGFSNIENSNASAPVWLKLARSGNTFTASRSSDGITWEETHQDIVEMGESIYVGIASYALHNNKTTRSEWSNVGIVQGQSMPVSPTALTLAYSNGVTLSWTDNSGNETGFRIERSLDGTSFQEIATVSANTTSYQDNTQTLGATFYYRVQAFNNTGDSGYSEVASIVPPSTGELPQGWASADVGNVALVGSTSYNQGEFTVTGNGYMTESFDNFHYAYQQLSGDSEIIAKLDFVQQAGWNNTGLMMRETLDPNARYAMTLVNANAKIFFQRRSSAGFSSVENSNASAPVWLKLARSGNTFTASRSSDGITWEETHQDVVEMGGSIYVGIVSYAPHNNKSTRSEWSNVGIVQGQSAPVSPTALTLVYSNGVTLSWTDNSGNETGFRIERSLDGTSFQEIATVSANTTSYQDTPQTPGATFYYRVQAFNYTGDSGYSEVASIIPWSTGELPQGWASADVGNVALVGSTSYNEGEFTVIGNGYMTESFDNFHYVYQQLGGDSEIIAKLDFVQQAGWNNTGLMMRETLDPNARYAMTLVNANAKIFFQRRSSAGFSSVENSNASAPVWLKLARSGNTFTASRSSDGITWEEIHQDVVEMGRSMYVGIVSYAFHNNKSTKSEWNNVSVSLSPNELMPPSALTANSDLANKITLHWTDNSDNETGFWIERSVDGISFEEIATVSANVISYQEQTLAPGTYFYRIRAYNQDGNSSYSLVERADVLEYENTILFLSRLSGDHDKSNANNTITVTTGPGQVNEQNTYTGLRGKQIAVGLENTLSSSNGTISFKVIPDNLFQAADLFRSERLTIRQVDDRVTVTIDGSQWTSSARLDTITCNHIALRLNHPSIEIYVNGEWSSLSNNVAFDIHEFSLGEYNGQLWDVLLVDRLVSDEEIIKLSQRCVPGVDSSVYSPSQDQPNSLCGSYVCLWASNTKDLSQERFLYYLKQQEISYELFTFEIGMYDHSDLDGHLAGRHRRDIRIYEDESWVRYTFSNPMTKEDHNTSYWWHENFHDYQVGTPFGGSKWTREASANWAAWYRYDYPQRGVDKVTFDPHLPMLLHYAGYNRIYHWSIIFSYITKFVSEPAFIGRLHNNPQIERHAITALEDQLSKEGHDFEDVFVEFAARTAVWDYPDRSVSDAFAARDQAAIEAFENMGMVDFNHRFANVMPAEGTGGVMTAIPADLLPGVYAWNTYKVDSTAAATYTIRLKGKDINPEGTNFRAMIVKGSGISYEYFEMPVSETVAYGGGEAQFNIDTEAGEELYLVVVSTPSDYRDELLGSLYQYDYAIEAIPYGASTLLEANARKFIDDEEQAAGSTNDKGVKIYPNKTDGNITIRLTTAPGDHVEINIVNTLGIKAPFKAKQDGDKIHVKFEGPSGLYYVWIKSEHFDEKFKLFKE